MGFANHILRILVQIVSPKKHIINSISDSGAPIILSGRLLALDPGEKRVGVAISDEMHITARPLRVLQRTNWKKFLAEVKALLHEFDAKALVIGLPVSLDGIERSSAEEVRILARKFKLSLEIPIFLQDERLTTREAEESMLAAGKSPIEVRRFVDSESAAIILRDFITNAATRIEL